MRYAIAFALLWFLAAFSVSAWPYVKVAGVSPDLILIFVACWAVIRGQREAMVVVPMAGILRDLATGDPLGTSVIALAPIIVLAGLIGFQSAVETKFLPAIAVVAGGTLAYGFLSAGVLAATGHSVPVVDGLLRVLLPLTLVNMLFTPILYLPLLWLSAGPREGLQGAGRLTSPLS